MTNDKKAQMEAAWDQREKQVEKEKDIAWRKVEKNTGKVNE